MEGQWKITSPLILKQRFLSLKFQIILSEIKLENILNMQDIKSILNLREG